MIKKLSKVGNFIVTLAALCLLMAGTASALDIVMEPANAQREIGGKVRVHIYADNAEDLISMGVKVSFNPAVLQVDTASKYEMDSDTGWVMDADGDAATTGDQYKPMPIEIDNTAGTVTMLGGNIDGTATAGFSGKVLLGWIVFDAVANGSSDISFDLAKYHANHPTETFSNFVKLDGTVVDPTPDTLGNICVMAGAVIGDINGNNYVENGDYAMLRSAMMKGFPDPAYNVKADLNANGFVENGDYAILRSNMMKAVPACSY